MALRAVSASPFSAHATANHENTGLRASKFAASIAMATFQATSTRRAWHRILTMYLCARAGERAYISALIASSE